MRFGLQQPSFLFSSGAGEVYPETRRRALMAEEAGFESFWVMDHLWQIPGVGKPEEPFLEGWTTLAALAQATSSIRLGTLVTSVSYRNPALLAKVATTIDIISQGRIYLGIGGGWYEQEYRGYGYPFPRVGERLAQLREALRLIKLLWREPRVTFHGKYFQAEGCVLEPKPVQKPRPPILIGGGGERVTLRILAEEGDLSNFVGSPATVAHKIEVLKGHCQRVGRDFREIQITKLDSIILAPTRERAEEKWQRYGARSRDGYRMLVGTPEQVAGMVREFEALGVHMLIVNVTGNDEESLGLFTKEVMPAFRLAKG